MRVKARPRHYIIKPYIIVNSAVINRVFDSSRTSKSDACLRLNDSGEIMHRIFMDQQDSGPGIDEALDLAMPTRSRCQHEHFKPCFSLETDSAHSSSENQLSAIDLSINKSRLITESSTSRANSKETFLYRMLTDPIFLENLRKNQKPATYTCIYCKKNFSKEEDLSDHLNVRKDEKNQVACCACGKTFAQKRYLRYHQRCHTGRNKFTCDICTKNYSRLDNLTRHNTFHTNPDKFPCPSCERTFARKDLLKKHIKCHENRHRYHCGVCDKYFKGPLSLENHKKLFHSLV